MTIPPMPTTASGAEDVARRLGVSPKTIRRLIGRGELNVVRIGRRVVITEAAVAAMLARGAATTRSVAA